MSFFEENESLLDTLEAAESRVEKIKIGSADPADSRTRKQLALEVKTVVSRLVNNISASSGDVEALGGALVLMDLMEVLKRYDGVFDIDGLTEQIGILEKMWKESQ